MSSPYAIRPGGALKFKSGNKRKAKSSASNSVRQRADKEVAGELNDTHEPSSRSGSGSGRNNESSDRSHEQPPRARSRDTLPVTAPPDDPLPYMTKAERELLGNVAQKEARKTHKDRVNELNEYLDSMSEFHDMPRVAGA